MIARETLITSPGGDTIQINCTAEYLRRFGVEVDLVLSAGDVDYSSYDLIHFFNIIRPDDILPHVFKCQKPFVVSTIFVDYAEYEKNNRGPLGKFLSKVFSGDQIEYLKAISRFLINGNKIKSSYYLLNGHFSSVRLVASRAALLLPNSDSEFKRFQKVYRVDVPYKRIPNAVDISIFNDHVSPNNNYNDHILCVGRIEGRKNQLNLIKALANTPYKLTLIGKPSPNHYSYYQRCLDVIKDCTNIQIVEHISQGELASIYMAAKVHVLPSWIETTGLSSLEAGIMGCNLVVTKKGDTEEYFKDYAFYCEPDSVNSIKAAVDRAFAAERNTFFQRYIQENFTWEIAAKETFEGYRKALGLWKEKLR